MLNDLPNELLNSFCDVSSYYVAKSKTKTMDIDDKPERGHQCRLPLYFSKSY